MHHRQKGKTGFRSSFVARNLFEPNGSANPASIPVASEPSRSEHSLIVARLWFVVSNFCPARLRAFPCA